VTPRYYRVLVYDSSSTPRRIGLPVVAAPEVADFTAIKARIASGEIPADLRNEALVASNNEGDVWAALQTEAEIRRYAASGALLWRVTVTEPELTASREEFFRRNAAETNPRRFYSLRSFSDLALDGDKLWMLLSTSDEGNAVVLVLGADGTPLRRVEIAGGGGARSLAIDPTREKLYLFTAHDAQLLAASIP
jgi:hypothetical protein